jgi:hypothetical protein
MSTLETNLIQPATGTSLTIGASGDTITIPSGATLTNSGTATGFGKILQIVNSNNDYDTTVSSTSYGDVLSASGTTWETAITPSATSSTILVLYSLCIQTNAPASGHQEGRAKLKLQAKTGSGSYADANELIYAGAYDYGASGIVFGWHWTANYLHSPSTTSAVTFKFQMRIESSGDSVICNNLGTSRIQLLEVAG